MRSRAEIFFWQFLALASSLTFFPQAFADTRQVSVAVYDYEPLCHSAAENPTKVQPEHELMTSLLRRTAAEEGWHVEYVGCSLSECQELVKSGTVDVLVAAKYQKELEEEYRFTRQTVISTWAQVYTGRQRNPQSWLDLKGFALGVLTGDAHNAEARHIAESLGLNCTFVEFKHYRELLEAIESSWIDGGIVDRLYALLHDKHYQINRTPIVFSPSEIRFATSRLRDEALVNALDYHLARFKEEPGSVYHRLVGKLLGAEDQARIPRVLLWGFFGVAGFACTLLFVNLILQRQVKNKTRELEENVRSLKREVAARHEVEKALGESDAKLRSVALAAPIGIGVVSDFQLAWANGEFCRMTGYAPEEITERNVALFFPHEEELNRVERERTRKVRESSPAMVETRLRKKDGTFVDVLLSFAPFDSVSTIRGLTFAALDITDRRRALEALRAEHSFRTAIIDHAAEGLCVFRDIPEPPHVRLTLWNDRMIRITGFTMEEINRVGWTGTLFAHSPDIHDFEIRMDAAREGLHLRDEEWGITTAAGEHRMLSISTSTVHSADGGEHILMLAHDITERRKAAEALLQGKERLQAILDATAAAIMVVHQATGRIVQVNRAAVEMVGVSREEILLRPVDDFLCRGEATNGKKSSPECAWPFTGKECQLVRPGGRIPVLASTGCVVLDAEEALILSFVDLTDKKRLENQLQHAQRMEVVGTLAGGVAHDFNNLLQAIQSSVELMLLSEGNTGLIRKTIDQILHCVSRGAELTKQLLTFSRKVESRKQAVDLNREILATREILERTIPKMVEIHIDLQQDLGLIAADPVQLEQVLMNLAVNARDAMPDGGKLSISTRAVHLRNGFSSPHFQLEPGLFARLSVSDSGCGMERRTLERVFEPFFSTKGPGKGTGLGMSIVYGIVKNHGGAVGCESMVGKGTRFDVYFPLHEGESEAVGAARLECTASGGSETILVVDDEDIIREMCAMALSSCGYNVLTASSGEEALMVFHGRRDAVDLVLLDFIMPGMGGRKCLQEILRFNAAAKVIVASGYSEGNSQGQVLENGARAVLQKPYPIKDLLRTVRTVLDEGKHRFH